MNHLILFLIGFILMTIGCTFCILYFNLFVFGYSMLEYITFILKKWECYLFIIGFILIIISFIRKEKRK